MMSLISNLRVCVVKEALVGIKWWTLLHHSNVLIHDTSIPLKKGVESVERRFSRFRLYSIFSSPFRLN